MRIRTFATTAEYGAAKVNAATKRRTDKVSKKIVKIHEGDALNPIIRQIRNTEVVLDFEIAAAYGVPTKRLIEAMKRNHARFPKDFMFQLSSQEAEILKPQIATSSWGGARRPPYAFTEQGVAMLSGILRSPRAIKVNIAIMRSFVHMRKAFLSLNEIEKSFKGLDEGVVRAFVLIRALMKTHVRPALKS
jgi:hypothetical protein